MLAFCAHYGFVSSNATSVFQFTEEARVALCPFVSTTGMRCFDGVPLPRSGRSFGSDFTKLPRGVGISIDRSTGRLMAPAVQLTYTPAGSRTWTDGHTGMIFDLFNEATLGPAHQVAAAYDTARIHTFHNASRLNAVWRQTFADDAVHGGELARRPEMLEYFKNRDEALALSQRVIGLYTLRINASAIQLNEFALRALSQLTATFDADLYEDFLNTWGTHIITRSLVGGMIEERATVPRCSHVSDDARFAHCVPFSDSGPISSNCTYYASQIRVISKRLLGGNVEINNENQWRRTLAVRPALLQILEMVPWSDFITDNAVKQNLIAIMRNRQRYFDFIQAASVELVDSRLQPCVSGAQKMINSPYKSSTIPNIPCSARWERSGVTVAGGRGEGSDRNQLKKSYGIFIDNDETVIIADCFNHRVVQWKPSDTNGQIVAGGNGQGSSLNQLNHPSDVLIGKKMDSLIIADLGNRRVVQWSRRSETLQGEILIDNVACYGLAMDTQGYLYVPNALNNEVRRYRIGDKNGILVAGGNGQGSGLNQLNLPTHLFVDQQQNLYISDRHNHRVVKWNKEAKEGIVVAGGQGTGNAMAQLHHPEGIFVDQFSNLYVADEHNHRIIRWTQGANQGTVVVGGNGIRGGANHLNYPMSLAFDRHGNLYVSDHVNYRVQRFSLIKPH
ncbi:unnamed protein product [Rotaria socialis]|uniref:MACPF domain-containing protein n=1 Tax=Rotaria socialis TaxID=392032 RepID=A0A817TNG8_9BILA|nr:unnamed protein product [Rotaria socialis]CAF4600358.1 unnamed protein product [Rotaria socialis]